MQRRTERPGRWSPGFRLVPGPRVAQAGCPQLHPACGPTRAPVLCRPSLLDPLGAARRMGPWPRCPARGAAGRRRRGPPGTSSSTCGAACAWPGPRWAAVSRASEARACRATTSRWRVCDDYDVSRDEFFFDRSPAPSAPSWRCCAPEAEVAARPVPWPSGDELAYWGHRAEALERWLPARSRPPRVRRRPRRAGPAERAAPGSPACASGLAGGWRAGRAALRDVVDAPAPPGAGALRSACPWPRGRHGVGLASAPCVGHPRWQERG